MDPAHARYTHVTLRGTETHIDVADPSPEGQKLVVTIKRVDSPTEPQVIEVDKNVGALLALNQMLVGILSRNPSAARLLSDCPDDVRREPHNG